MAQQVFQVLNPETTIRYGKDLKTGASGIYPGLLVKLDTSGSTVTTSGSASANAPFGIAFGSRYRPYRPTSQTFDSGEPLTVVQGQGYALLSVDFWDEAALPSSNAGSAVYASQSGKWTMNITANKVGTFVGIRTRSEPVGGVGVSQNLALVRFLLEPFT